ncbi:MAG: hypothetical protein LH467_12755 [Gemmatimonadaceae bacterium]|nr:hypothetical protein [Gemmatimonadaceae bacterium]
MRPIRQILLFLAFVPAIMGTWRLIQLPMIARNNGAGDGSWWTSAIVAVLLACAALCAGLVIAWCLELRGSRVAALVPFVGTAIVVYGRRLSAQGGPEEMYLLDDAKLWIIFLGAAIVLCALAAAMPLAERRVHDMREDR